MKLFHLFPAFLVALGVAASGRADSLRPPSVPLVTHSPYFSIWSANDKLTDGPTRHWTGAEQKLTSLIRIDGETFRLMGAEPASVKPLPQKNLEVTPTRTNYRFANTKVEVVLSFLSPLLPENLDVLSRPVTYITWTARSVDGRNREVSVYLDAASELAVDKPTQAVVAQREKTDGLVVLKTGSQDQPILGRKGDDLRIDWGYAYLAAPDAETQGAIGPFTEITNAFAKTGQLPSTGDLLSPRAANDSLPVIALSLDLGKVGAKPVSRFAMLAYDEIEAIQYFRKNLQPYWRRNGADALTLLKTSAAGYGQLQKASAAFDAALVADLTKAGGKAYAEIGALAYRQALAAHGLVADKNGQPLFFSKENFSNGCIATVDVTYPSAPLFLLASPALMKAMIVPVLDYAQSDRWKFPFAPHDLGTYPQANGQVYGGGERTEDDQMPVEESGNLMLLVAAIAKVEGNPSFAGKYWPTLTKWAGYLAEKGFDPANQLCTDDFAGHLAHNVNLSIKAIEALGAYAELCKMRGDNAEAAKYRKLAESFAQKWVEKAKDGAHTRLAFDKAGTWSQKYNLVWDRLLGIDLFPPDVAKSEIAYYRTKQNKYGLPLDSRESYTKLDWIIWSATLSGDPEDFAAFIEPIHAFLNETPDRVPMTDWYRTREPKQRGFQARSVVGGVFIKLLDNPPAWKKWAAAGEKIDGNWAKQPTLPKQTIIVPAEQEWRYSFDQPAADWFAVDFNDRTWKLGSAPFGTEGSSVKSRTQWNTSDIWMRREFTMPAPPPGELKVRIVHDEDADVYLNGIPAGTVSGFSPEFVTLPISKEARATIKPGGKTVLAVHCHQTVLGQMIDAGLVGESAPEE